MVPRTFLASMADYARLVVVGLGFTSFSLIGSPTIAAVTDAVDYSSRVTVNGFISIFGTGLSPDGPHAAASLPLPTKLGSVTVLLCDAANQGSCEVERLVYVDQNQVNFLAGNPTYKSAIVRVVVDQTGTSNSSSVTLLKFAPAIFIEGTDCLIDPRFTNRDLRCGLTAGIAAGSSPRAIRGAITDLNGHLLQASNPTYSSTYFTVWAGGLGIFKDGKPPASVQLRLDGAPTYFQSGTLSQLSLAPVYVAESAQFPGLYQLNFQVPPGLIPFPCGDYKWEFQAVLTEGDSPTSQPVDLPVTLSAYSLQCLQPVTVPSYSDGITVIRGQRGGSTDLPGSALIPMTNPAFRYSGATMALVGPDIPRNLYVFADPADLHSTDSTLPYDVDFIFDGRQFEIAELGTGGHYRISVDGARITQDPQSGPSADGVPYLERVAFATPGHRVIRIEAADFFVFGGIRILPGDQVSAPTDTLGRRAIFAGDSFTEGGMGYANTAARLLNWEGWASGSGGTGYLNPGRLKAAPPRVKLADRIAADICPFNPAVVLVAMGINDSFYLASPPFNYSSAQIISAIHDEATRDFLSIHQCVPNARIIVLGPWSSKTPVESSLAAVDAGVQAAATELALPFISPVQESWINGNKDVPGSGNAVGFIGADGLHPTQSGHNYLGFRLATRVLQVAPDLVIQATP